MQVRLGTALWLVWWGARNLLPGAARESGRARAMLEAETGWWVQWVSFLGGFRGFLLPGGDANVSFQEPKTLGGKGGLEYKTSQQHDVADV